ncbi:hypothetical protein PRZ48_012599 [Zasmidium cellare]|uniref:2EXR domain-containing protein n=1 Tax=Zasmidium cellare TaxID=395010 RepID=A0ABR0E5L7_ZASCE|nr:hypothetical protein PRZ48_012599 [Zasmidium cellare]
MPVPWDDPYPIAKHNASSPLLKLPAELRIEIYKYCLVESDRINVNVPFSRFAHRIYRHSPHLKVQPPELFRVSRQIRQETIPIYFRHNEFRVFALNYDVVPYAKFLRWHLAYGKPEGLTLRYVGRPDWGNLVKWLKLAYLGKCAPPEKREGFWADARRNV